MTNSPLQLAVERYEKAIDALEHAETLSVDLILEALIARDAVHTALSSRDYGTPVALINTVRDLDDRLRKQAKTIRQIVKLADWQAVLNPPKKDWWWTTDPNWSDRLDWLWELLAIGFLAASVAILLDISTRLFSGTPDLAGILAIATPAVITLIAGGALTKGGREVIQRMLDSFGAPRRLWDEFTCIFSGLILISTIFAWIFLLPLLAFHYESRGDSAHANAYLVQAEEHYQRAIKLNPDSSVFQTKIRYKLAKVYEDMPEGTDRAIAEYQNILKSEKTERNYDAIAKQAKLFILKGKKDKDAYSEAISRFEEIESYMKNREPLVRYSYLIDWGSAHLGQGDPGEAKVKFQESVQLFSQKAIGHCLLAQAYEKLNDPQNATNSWLDCISFANPAVDSSEAKLLSMARRKIGQQYIASLTRGQKFFRQKDYQKARAEFERAINILGNRAIAYCLLAQTLEKQGDRSRATANWEQCLAYASRDNQDEAVWIKVARQRVTRQKQGVSQ